MKVLIHPCKRREDFIDNPWRDFEKHKFAMMHNDSASFEMVNRLSCNCDIFSVEKSVRDEVLFNCSFTKSVISFFFFFG